jgi:hypothetical protein
MFLVAFDILMIPIAVLGYSEEHPSRGYMYGGKDGGN